MSAPRHEFYCFIVPPSKRYLLPSPLWITANFPEEISNLINLISRGREIKKMGRLQVSKRLNFSKGKMKKFRILQLCFNYSSLEKLKNLSRFYCYDSFSLPSEFSPRCGLIKSPCKRIFQKLEIPREFLSILGEFLLQSFAN